MARRLWWESARWTIATRSALTAALAVAGALLVGAAALLFVLHRELVAALDDATATRTHDIVAALRAEPPAELDAPLFDTDTRVALVQVIDASGQVVRSSDTQSNTSVIETDAGVARAPDRDIRALHRSGVDLRVSASETESVDGRNVLVLVAASEESVEATLLTVATLLAVGAPAIVAVVALVTHRLVRRSLGSVEDIRAQVATMSSLDLGQRVPVPPIKDEIAALATTMNDMLARVQSGHEAQRRFVADASHELRSPLATITAALDLLRARPQLASELLTSTVIPEVDRMRKLIDDLLLLARADEHGLPLRIGDVDLDDIVVEQVRLTAVPESVTVTVDAPPVRLAGDADRLRQMLRNLLDNAVRYAESLVRVHVQADSATTQLTVTDDGPGVPEADRHRVFERFVRLDNARGRGSGGAGLDLPIVAEIVVAHGGTVTIGTAGDGGTCVRVVLPRTGPRSAAQPGR